MLPPLLIQNHGPLLFRAALPQGWQGPVLPGGHSLTYEGELGHVVIQEYRTASWRIRYTVFRFAKKLRFQWAEDYYLRLQFALEGDFVYEKQKTRFRLPGNKVNAIWSPGETTHATVAGSKEYRLFHALFAPDIVRQLVPGFPATPLADERHSTPIEEECQKSIQGILNAPYNNETLRFYFENRVRDCLLYFLLRPGAAIRYEGLTSEEVNTIRRVDALIRSDVRKWLHIPALARLAHMTEFKLKTAFKTVIGMGLFERLREARLEQARQLLLHTDEQIKVIHAKVGYKSISGFEDAFREKYGLPPLRYRKVHRLQS